MKTMINISGIAVKDKYDILKAAEILERIGVIIFSSEERKEACLGWDNVQDNFLMQDEDGWRIQSHLMKERFTVETLEKFVDNLLQDNPGIKDDISKLYQLKEKINSSADEFDRLNNCLQNAANNPNQIR